MPPLLKSINPTPVLPSPTFPCPLGCTCFVLPFSDCSLPLLLRIFLAAGLEQAYLHQPRRFYRAGLAKVCVTKMKDIFLYSECKLIISNALFHTTLKPQDVLTNPTPPLQLRIPDSGGFPPALLLLLPPPPCASSRFLSLSPLLSLPFFSSFFMLTFLAPFLIPEYSPFSSCWH